MTNLSQSSIARSPKPAHATLSAPARPSIATLELTTRCDNRCSGCSNADLVERRELRTDHLGMMRDWKKIITRIVAEKKGEPLVIRLSGGEPTLHPDFHDIVHYIDGLGIPHALLSTGRWAHIGAENILQLYKNCNHAAGILVSLHGADSEAHSAFTQTGAVAFRQTCENIHRAAQAGITVFTNSVLTSANCSQIEKIVTLSKKSGAECAVFNRFIAEGHPLQPDIQQFTEAVGKIVALKKQGFAVRIGNSIPKCFLTLSAFPTVAGYELCHIGPDGLVRPDNLTLHSFGNILEASLTRIWQSDTAWAYRAHFPDACLQCAALPACRGGVKSPGFGSRFVGDPLMTRPLTLEDIADIDDDKDKRRLAVLALTSD